MWDDIEAALDIKVREQKAAIEEVKQSIDEYQAEILKMIEDAKKNEILNELKKVNARLDNMERRLPPEINTVNEDTAVAKIR